MEGNIETVVETLESPENAGRVKRFYGYLREQTQHVKPMKEFFARPTVPKTYAEASKRLYHNVSAFRSNYVLMVAGIALYALITSPSLIFAIAVLFAGLHIGTKNKGSEVTLMGKSVSGKQVLAGTITLAVPLLWLAGATSVIFWFFGASLFAVGLHGALIAAPEALPTTGN